MNISHKSLKEIVILSSNIWTQDTDRLQLIENLIRIRPRFYFTRVQIRRFILVIIGDDLIAILFKLIDEVIPTCENVYIKIVFRQIYTFLE